MSCSCCLCLFLITRDTLHILCVSSLGLNSGAISVEVQVTNKPSLSASIYFLRKCFDGKNRLVQILVTKIANISAECCTTYTSP